MKKSYDIIIIGGGIIGTSIAFEMAKRGYNDILIIEKKYLSAGQTGRCGAGIRQQWGSELNATLAKDSVEIFEKLEEYTGYNDSCGLNQVGYLLLAYNEKEWKIFQENMKVQHKLGIESRIVDLEKEIFEIAPSINTDGIFGATFCQTDGNAEPFQCTLAYAKGAQRLGVDILTYTEVKELIAKKGKIKGVRTTKGDFEAPMVINCANIWAPALSAQVGDEIPIFPERHQALITEKVAPIGPNNTPMTMVMSWEHRFFCQQLQNGSFIMGGIEAVPLSLNNASWQNLEETCYVIGKTIPALRNLRILRQWNGHFDVSPDHTPIISFSKNAEGLITVCGFSGHGFMIAPRTAVMVAKALCNEADTIDIKKFSEERYFTNEMLFEPAAL